MGWITAAVAIGTKIYSEVKDAGDTGLPIDQYYPAVKSLQLLCPGPYDIGTVAQALANNPEFIPQVDAILARDGAWMPGGNYYYGPLDLAQKASALVNWAHGGRDCSVVGDEATLSQTIDAILAAEAQRQRSAVSQVTQTLEQSGITPVQLALGALSAFLLLRGK